MPSRSTGERPDCGESGLVQSEGAGVEGGDGDSAEPQARYLPLDPAASYAYAVRYLEREYAELACRTYIGVGVAAFRVTPAIICAQATAVVDLRVVPFGARLLERLADVAGRGAAHVAAVGVATVGICSPQQLELGAVV